jgi:hypothetical protein
MLMSWKCLKAQIITHTPTVTNTNRNNQIPYAITGLVVQEFLIVDQVESLFGTHLEFLNGFWTWSTGPGRQYYNGHILGLQVYITLHTLPHNSLSSPSPTLSQTHS